MDQCLALIGGFAIRTGGASGELTPLGEDGGERLGDGCGIGMFQRNKAHSHPVQNGNAIHELHDRGQTPEIVGG